MKKRQRKKNNKKFLNKVLKYANIKNKVVVVMGRGSVKYNEILNKLIEINKT